MATKVSFLIQLKNQFSKQATAIRTSARRLNKEFVKLTKTINKSSIALRKIGGIAKTTRGRLTKLSIKGVASLKKIGNTATKTKSKISAFSTKSVTSIRKLGSSFVNLESKVRTNNTKIMILGNKASQTARKISGLAGKLSGRFSSALAGANAQITKTSSKLANLGRKARAVGRSISDFGGTLFRRATLPLGVLATGALVMSAKLESMQISFETMTGSAKAGQEVLEKLINFAATTPFRLEGIAKAAKTLLAFRVPVEELLPILRRLGDIAAGTDTPIQGIAKIFGKAREKTKLMTEELLQLSERGIPIIGLLAEKLEKLGVPAEVASGQVFKLASQSKITFLVMEAALRKTTEVGGIFFDQTIRQARTLGGAFSTLKDNLGFTLGAFGDVLVSVTGLKTRMITLNGELLKFPTAIREFAKANPILTNLITIFVAFLAVIGPVLIAVGQFVIFAGFMVFAAQKLGIALGATLILAGTITAAFVLLAAAGFLIVKNWEQMKAGAVSFFKNIPKHFSDLIDLVSTLGKVMTSAFLLPITAIGSAIADFLFGPIKKAKGELNGLASFSGGELQINSNQSSTQSSTTDVNINLVGPPRVIESIKTRSSGQVSGLNVGVNMVIAN